MPARAEQVLVVGVVVVVALAGDRRHLALLATSLNQQISSSFKSFPFVIHPALALARGEVTKLASGANSALVGLKVKERKRKREKAGSSVEILHLSQFRALYS